MSGVIRDSCPNSAVLDETTNQPLKIRSIDPDLGRSGEVTYRFTGPGAEVHSGFFIIDSKTGVLRLRSKIDQVEMRPSVYLLTIEATDQGEPVVRAADSLIRVRVRFDDSNRVNIAPLHFPATSNPLVVNIFLPTYQDAEIARFTAISPNNDNFVSYFYKFKLLAFTWNDILVYRFSLLTNPIVYHF